MTYNVLIDLVHVWRNGLFVRIIIECDACSELIVLYDYLMFLQSLFRNLNWYCNCVGHNDLTP